MLVTYDVCTLTPQGRRRLRRVARACLDFGQRVQYSVFELEVGAKEWAQARHRLLEEYNVKEDSLRFYYLGEDGARRTEHHGVNGAIDFEDTLVV